MTEPAITCQKFKIESNLILLARLELVSTAYNWRECLPILSAV